MSVLHSSTLLSSFLACSSLIMIRGCFYRECKSKTVIIMPDSLIVWPQMSAFNVRFGLRIGFGKVTGIMRRFYNLKSDYGNSIKSFMGMENVGKSRRPAKWAEIELVGAWQLVRSAAAPQNGSGNVT